MITVRVEPNGKYWRARWTTPTGQRGSRGLGKCSKREAKVKAKRLELELNNGRASSERAPTLEEHIKRFLANRLDLAEGTRDLYEQTGRYLRGFFSPGLRIDKITRFEAANWRTAIATGMFVKLNKRECKTPSESTVCRHVREAKTLFQMATDEDQIPLNPFSRLNGTAPIPDKNWAYIDQTTLDKFLDACPTLAWKLLISLCRFAGLRQGEAFRLDWNHIDLDARRLTVANPGRHKTTKKRTRTVPITGSLHDILFEAFMSDDRGNMVVQPADLPKQKHLWKAYHSICEKAGLEPWARWCHTLRKNCETDWAAVRPIHVVTEWLGNSPEVAMKHYVHATDDDFKVASKFQLAPKLPQSANSQEVSESQELTNK